MPSTAPVPNKALASFKSEGSFFQSALLADGHGVTSRIGTLASGKYSPGQILSITPATGALVPAVIGSAAPNCVLAEYADATGGSVQALVYLTGRMKADQIIWPAAGSHADHTDLLRDVGIYLESVLYKDGTIVKSVPTAEDEAHAKKQLDEARKRWEEPKEIEAEKITITDSPWAYMTEEERLTKPQLSAAPIELTEDLEPSIEGTGREVKPEKEKERDKERDKDRAEQPKGPVVPPAKPHEKK